MEKELASLKSQLLQQKQLLRQLDEVSDLCFYSHIVTFCCYYVLHLLRMDNGCHIIYHSVFIFKIMHGLINWPLEI